MAKIYYVRQEQRSPWRVCWYPPNSTTRSTRAFRSEAEASEFVAAGIPGGERPVRHGKRRRSAAEVGEFIRANSVARDSGCHEWTRPLTTEGYPRLDWISDEGYVVRGAHRIAHHIFVGTVPNDHLMSVDHLCRNRACVNPDHLELVTQRENVMRSPIAPGATNARKTHCAQGHPYSEENTYVYTFKTRRVTTRICRTCAAEHQRRYYLRRMGGAA